MTKSKGCNPIGRGVLGRYGKGKFTTRADHIGRVGRQLDGMYLTPVTHRHGKVVETDDPARDPGQPSTRADWLVRWKVANAKGKDAVSALYKQIVAESGKDIDFVKRTIRRLKAAAKLKAEAKAKTDAKALKK